MFQNVLNTATLSEESISLQIEQISTFLPRNYPRTMIWIFLLTTYFPSIFASVLRCDLDNPCPASFYCAYDGAVVGLQVCQKSNGTKTLIKSAGRCPTPSFFTTTTATTVSPTVTPAMQFCDVHEDCPNNQHCCPTLFGYSVCSDVTPIDPSPKVTTIIQGSSTLASVQPLTANMIGSVTLIQSNGFNILVDSANVRQKMQLIEALADRAGLVPDDIDYLVITHGHPDHYSNSDLFNNVPSSYYSYRIDGSRITNVVGRQRYFINNDTNTEIILTPGHTNECVSVIVRNVTNRGTIAVTGDLFNDQEDYNQPPSPLFTFNAEALANSRQIVACMVNYIVPGHGAIFRVSPTMKNYFNCTPATTVSVTGAPTAAATLITPPTTLITAATTTPITIATTPSPTVGATTIVTTGSTRTN